MKWKITETENQVHVMPKYEEHEESMNCHCEPNIEFYKRTLIIHRSYDGRELIEEANEVLGND